MDAEAIEDAIRGEFSRLNELNNGMLCVKREGLGYKASYFVNDESGNRSFFSGYACEARMFLDINDKTATWHELWLSNGYKGKGYGPSIVHAAERSFRQLGIESAFIAININEKFWGKMGYPQSYKALTKKKASLINAVSSCFKSLSFYSKKDTIEIERLYSGVFAVVYSASNPAGSLKCEAKLDFSNKEAAYMVKAPDESHKNSLCESAEKLFSGFGMKHSRVENCSKSGCVFLHE